jgi:hypothetical protein
MASFTPQNAPASVTMAHFRAAVDKMGGPAKQCRFAVRLLPPTAMLLGNLGLVQDLTYLCEAAEFPGRGFDPIPITYYGPSFERPYAPAYTKQTDFTFICRTESYEREFFDNWMELVNPSSTFNFKYAKDYMCEIQVFQFADYAKVANDAAPKPVYQWTLLQCWPILVNPQPITWADSSDILRLSVRFSYKNWYRPGKDATGTQGQISITPSGL